MKPFKNTKDTIVDGIKLPKRVLLGMIDTVAVLKTNGNISLFVWHSNVEQHKS